MSSVKIKQKMEDLQQAIDRLQPRINSLLAERHELETQSRKLKSIVFIAENNIDKSKVQRCDGEGITYFNTIYQFGEWLKLNSTKPWCCWNGLLYESSEIENGRMSRSPVGRYEDL